MAVINTRNFDIEVETERLGAGEAISRIAVYIADGYDGNITVAYIDEAKNTEYDDLKRFVIAELDDLIAGIEKAKAEVTKLVQPSISTQSIRYYMGWSDNPIAPSRSHRSVRKHR